MAAANTLLVQKDARGRVSLGALMTDDRYLVTRDAQGRIILEPAVVMTATEQALLTDPGFIRKMTEEAAAPAARMELDEI